MFLDLQAQQLLVKDPLVLLEEEEELEVLDRVALEAVIIQFPLDKHL